MKMQTVVSIARLNPIPASDEQLISQVLAGSPQAQTQLVQRFGRLVRAVVSRYLTAHDDIEEAVQDAFLRAFRALPGFRAECKLSTWLSRVAVSAALNHLRSGRRWEQHELGYDDQLQHLPDETLAHPLERYETSRWLGHAMRQLGEKDLAVLDRFYLQEQSIEEIRQATGWSVSDVKSRLCRARRRLRTVIETQYAQELLN